MLLSLNTFAAEMEDFSIVDLPYKYNMLQVIAHMSDSKECAVSMSKDDFYKRYAKDVKELFELVKEVCEKDSR